MKSSSNNKLITIGRVLKTKGVEGQLRILPLTFDPMRFKALQDIYLEREGTIYQKAIEDSKIDGKKVVLKLRNIDSPEEASFFIGAEIKIPESESPELPEGVYYHYQLINLEVFTDTGRFIGIIKKIIETGSNDVYTVVNDDREILVPAIKEVVKEINLEKNRIIIHPIRGLLDDF